MNSLVNAIKNKKVKDWFYEFYNGHPFLLNEEVDIICDTRSEEKYLWMNDTQIKKLINLRIKEMYKNKFPNIKRFSLPIL